ncbi:MAG: ASPIC/UnbV domain-containing protein [Verrucomicrobiia bacterium]
MPTRGFLSQSELPLTFGLGGAEAVDEMTVIWPGGSPQAVRNVPIDKLTVIEQQP